MPKKMPGWKVEIAVTNQNGSETVFKTSLRMPPKQLPMAAARLVAKTVHAMQKAEEPSQPSEPTPS